MRQTSRGPILQNVPSWRTIPAKWNNLFHDHEIYVRTGGEVRFVRLSANLQRRAVSIAAGIASAWLLATAAIVGYQAYATWQVGDVAARAAAVEAAEAKVAAERRSVEGIAASLEARTDYLSATISTHFGAELDGAPMPAPGATVQPARDQVSRLDAIGARQDRLVATLTAAVARRAARAEAALRTVGLNATARGEAMGGPFIADRRRAPVPRDPALRRLTAAIERMEALEALVVALPSNLPADTMALSSGFGYRRDPFNGHSAMHAGLDFKGRHGSAIRAAAAGRIAFVGSKGGYGNVIEVDHGHGIMTRYAHLSGFTTRVGQMVTAGQHIGRMGSTGRSTGTHLHFEVRVGGTAVNPRRFLEANAHVLEVQADAGQRARIRVAAR